MVPRDKIQPMCRLEICSIHAVLPVTLLILLITGSFPEARAQSDDLREKMMSLIDSEQFELAVELLNERARQSPNDVQVQYLLGTVLHAQKQYDEAIIYHLKAARVVRYRSAALYNLARTYARVNDQRQCLDALRTSVRYGFLNRERLMAESDFERFRDLPEFRALIPAVLKGADLFEGPSEAIWEARGENEFDEFGHAVGRAGDLNDDGAEDFFVSAPRWRRGDGQIYFYSGKTREVLFTLQGREQELFGWACASVKDLDGDEVPDLLIGAPRGGEDGEGCVYVISGGRQTVIRKITGDRPGEEFGYRVLVIGDVDDDRYADWVVAARRAHGETLQSGRVTIYSGRKSDEILVISGQREGAAFGSAMAWVQARIEPANKPGTLLEGQLLAIGTVNGGEFDSGLVRIYSIADGKIESEMTIEGDRSHRFFGGGALSFIEDVDGDGYPDLAVGNSSSAKEGSVNGPTAGRINLFSGRTGRMLLEQFGQGSERLGQAIDVVADVDSDGLPDVLVGSSADSDVAESAGSLKVYSSRTGQLMLHWRCLQANESMGTSLSVLEDDGEGEGTGILIGAMFSRASGKRSGRVVLLKFPDR